MKEKKDIKQYRIGDYAHYMGVTSDFLKHYEQFHLISSEVMENGYRYYPFYQSSKLLECMKLRNYGDREANYISPGYFARISAIFPMDRTDVR